MLNCFQNNQNKFWEGLEAKKDRPKYCTSLISIPYNEFINSFEDEKKIQSYIKQLFSGKIFIIKGAFDCAFIKKLKVDFNHFVKSKPSEFHKMLENCPDFHRVIDEEVTKNYSMRAIKHSAYFFPWNGDPYNMFTKINERWRYLKYLGGKNFNEFEKNTPKDKIVDRIQLLKYPQGGELQQHCDPFHNQRMFISIYMSKRQKDGDFETGGFYSLDENKKVIDIEPFIDEGDIGFGYATVIHGVSKIDGDYFEKGNFKIDKGRWFLGLYSNDSDENKERKTSIAINTN